MGELLDLALYNPSRLTDEDFLAGFVARQGVADKILSKLREIKSGGLAQHRLIVGQRGMGKTSLLRRIALGVRRDPELAAVLIPLSFREEQYNVHSLHVLWCNCLDALGDYFEASGEEKKARELDLAVAALDRVGDTDGNRAFELFHEWFKREGRRPLLLIDNLDIVLAGLAKYEWTLRRVLQKAGGVVVIGASTSALEAAVHPEESFYDFFQVDVLERLGLDEVMTCLRRLASLRGEAGKAVQHLIASDPARVQVLHDLTGGNPRTLAMLYLVLEATDSDDVMVDLEKLLDQATPLYKARVEELAPQARVVFDAVALTWDPVTATDLATVTTLETNAVSAQLDRLVRDGVVEKTSLSTTRRNGFQVSERFFNIWYLMRHGPRRQRQRLKWLAEALRRIYTPAELEGRAKKILDSPLARQHPNHAAYWLAISDALEDGPLRTSLAHYAYLGDPRLRDESLFREENSEPSQVSQATKEEGLHRAVANNPGDPEGWSALGWSLLDSGRTDEAEAALKSAIEIDPDHILSWGRLGVLLQQLNRVEEAEEAFRKVLEVDPKHFEAWASLGSMLRRLNRVDEAEAAFRRAVEIEPKNSWAWGELGLLLKKLKRLNEAEAAFRQAIESELTYVLAWGRLGSLLQDLGRFEEAEKTFRRVIEIDPTPARAWSSLGLVLQDLTRFDEAEAAFRSAIDVDPTYAWAWDSLGSLLQELKRLDEAEAAFRSAIDVDPSHGWAWDSLGLLLQELKRFDDAEAAFRSAIDVDPSHGWAWDSLGLLLQELRRFPEAEAAFRQAIQVEPTYASAWDSLGNLLADQLNRTSEAENAYLRAIELAPEDLSHRSNLAYLLISEGRFSEAEEHFRAATTNLPPHGAGLLRAFRHLAESNLNEALDELNSVLKENHPELFTYFRDDLMRCLRLAASKDWGDRLLDQLHTSGLGDRFQPLAVAYDAYLHGEDRLMDVNPEVRGGARRLLDELTGASPQGDLEVAVSAEKKKRKGPSGTKPK